MPKIKNTTFKFTPTWQLVSAILLFVSAVLISRGQNMTTFEQDIFMFVYGWSSQLHPFFITVTQLGGIYMLGLLVAVYLVIKKYHIVIRLLLTGLLAYLAAGVAKDLWGTDRPFEYLLNVTSLEYLVRGPAFPSGHMALATALAFTVGHYLDKRYRWILVIALVGVGLSRIYLGVHAPIDLVGGFAIGWASYALFRHVRMQDMTISHKKSSKT